jgi:hypothetical protein
LEAPLSHLAESIFTAFFPAVGCSIGLVFLLVLFTSIPMALARRKIMLDSSKQFTEITIEQELARQFPALYNIRIYIVPAMIGSMILIYIAAFLLLYFSNFTLMPF